MIFLKVLQIFENIQHFLSTVIFNAVRSYVLEVFFLFEVIQFVLHDHLMFLLIRVVLLIEGTHHVCFQFVVGADLAHQIQYYAVELLIAGLVQVHDHEFLLVLLIFFVGFGLFCGPHVQKIHYKLLLEIFHAQGVPHYDGLRVVQRVLILLLALAGVLEYLLADIDESACIDFVKVLLQSHFNGLHYETVLRLIKLCAQDGAVFLLHCAGNDFIDEFNDVENHEHIVGTLQSLGEYGQKRGILLFFGKLLENGNNALAVLCPPDVVFQQGQTVSTDWCANGVEDVQDDVAVVLLLLDFVVKLFGVVRGECLDEPQHVDLVAKVGLVPIQIGLRFLLQYCQDAVDAVHLYEFVVCFPTYIVRCTGQ